MKELLIGNARRRTAVVYRLGGIGKTQLAVAYIKGHRSDYSAAIWINWILRYHPSIAYIVGALQSRDLDEIVKAVKRWLDEPMNDR
ncbi:hypothetical protein N7449_005153 [Penicillium cf. viridicatum]|uniref:NB-ARC domain-containing protein n=1 Tax=Penicillium cf. viridicatum TaxID=2972119 RepID=A0A9W9SYS6_9EURO|nr:hypothetical protein N7449_005153 [Penicillium cf. viridicatum]